MKTVFKWFAGLILGVALLAGVLYYIGGNTYEYHAEVTIDAPPETVFVYLTEPDHVVEWVDGMSEIKPLTEGGHKVGARSELVIEEDGQRYIMRDEVVKSEEGELVETKIDSELFTGRLRFELTERDGKTYVKETYRTDYKGPMRLFAPFVTNTIENQLQADLHSLKKLVENGSEQEQETI